MRTTSAATLLTTAALLALLAGCGRKEAPDAAQASAAEAGSGAAPAAPAPFDLAAVPLSTAQLPPFPFLAWPDVVPESDRHVAREAEFDATTVIAGDALRDIEGRLQRRQFPVPSGSSQAALRRQLADQIAGLGGVKVEGPAPVTDAGTITARVRELAGPDADVPARLGLSHYDEGSYFYDVFVLRTAEATDWFVLQSSQYTVVVTTVQAAPLAPG